VSDAHVVDDMTRWLLQRVDWIAEQPWVDEFLTEAAGLRGTNMARWPLVDRSRPLRGLTCLRCEGTTLVLHPPASAGWPIAIICSNARCGYSMPEGEWVRVTGWFEQHQKRA